tara:strand:- start:1040 stop:1681 length:642 start_codon:yes stop_codon:yes gene_type:complete
MKWSKEEIMAYVDGQLPEEEILRIEEAINQDSNAKDYYNALTDSNELIDITYNTIEKSYVSRTNQAKTTLSNKQNEKNIYPQNTNSIAISLRGVFGIGLLALMLAIGTYQIGKNSQNILNKQQALDMYAIKNIMENKEIIQNHINQNNLNDLRIQFDDNTAALVRFRSRSQDEGKFCQNFIVDIENISYDFNTCNNISTKEDQWNYQLQKPLN